LTRLILFEPAHRRVGADLQRLAPDLELALVSREGAITRSGAPIGEDDAQPDWGWFSADSGQSPGGRNLFIAMLKSRSLDWVHTGAAGVDGPIWRQLVAKGAELTTGHGQAISIAEYVIGGVLEHLQRWPERHAERAARRWARLPFREVAGSRWLVIGFGAIGQAVAERARAFGAEITGVRRSGAPHAAADRVAALSEVKRLLPEADVVVLAAPLNAETAGLADAAFFAAMKPGSVLVNIGRGGLVDEAALLAALDAGVPEHALLDVFRTEPLPEDSPFWAHPRVALTGHASAFGSGQTARNDALFLENLRRKLAGEPLLHEADPRDLAS
jgi:phosphoglycerate dehydrogenase-like enzyme